MSKTFSAKTLAVMLAAGLLTTGSAYAATAGAQEEAPQAVQQATGTCTGTVYDEEGEPLVGATVRVEGTQLASATDIDGKFSINGVRNGATVVVSYVGYSPVSIRWNGQPLTITMQSDSNILDEVVIMGYGVEQKRSKVTNSISKVSEQTFSIGANANPAQALAGAVAGVKVNVVSGDPNDVPSIVIRGGTMADGKGEPVYVVDGQIRSSMADINPNDIADMQILKDSGATALYGARAANGVVLITTKQGQVGTSSINFNMKWGLNYRNTGYTPVSAREYLEITRKVTYESPWATQAQKDGYLWGNVMNGIGRTQVTPDMMWNVMTLTDENRYLLNYPGWETMPDPISDATILFKETDILGHNGNNGYLTQDYNVSFQGGNEKGTYYAALGYYDQEGALATTFYKRYNFTFTGSYKITNWLQANSVFTFTRANYNSNPALTNSSEGNYAGNGNQYFSRMAFAPPTVRFTDEEGNQTLGQFGVANPWNLRFQPDAFDVKNQRDKFQMSQSLTATIIPGLTIKGTMSWYYNENNNKSFYHDYVTAVNGDGSYNLNTAHQTWEEFSRYFDQTYNLVANFTRTFNDKHYVNAMIGTEFYQRDYNYFYAGGSGAPTGYFPNLNLTNQDNGRTISSTKYKQRILSYFGRVEYDYMDKYLIAATFREDGYSVLVNNKWGFFPGVSGGWVFSKENFWVDSPSLQWWNYGKLRASWGMNGSVNAIGSNDNPYVLQGTYSAYLYDGNYGYRLNTLPFPDLRWEKTRTAEVGIDVGFLQNRFNLGLTYYNRLTSDKIASMNLPQTSGFPSITTNNGKLRNQGLEIDINTTLFRNRDWQWTLGANLTYNKLVIVELPDNGNENNRQGGTQVYRMGSDELMWIGGTQEGQEPMSIIGYKVDHIIQHVGDWPAGYADGSVGGKGLYADEAGKAKLLANGYTEANVYQLEPGMVIWQDRNGDGYIRAYDQYELGHRLPHWSGGFNTQLTWKGLSLYARFDMGFDFTTYDGSLAWLLGMGQGQYSFPTNIYDCWSPEHTNAKYPKAMWGNSQMTIANSMFAQPGAYLACRELMLSYSLPLSITEKFKCKGLTLSITGQNLGYLKKCTNPLPDQTSRVNGSTSGWGGIYPLPRTVLFGLNVTF